MLNEERSSIFRHLFSSDLFILSKDCVETIGLLRASGYDEPPRFADQREEFVMRSLEKIICPFDLNVKNEEVPTAKMAWSLAEKTGASLEIIYANPFFELSNGYGPYLDGVTYSQMMSAARPDEMEKDDRKQIRTVLSEAGLPMEASRIKVSCRVCSPATMLDDAMAESDTSTTLLVMSKSLSSGLTDFIIGSLTNRAIRLSPVPVLVFPTRFAIEEENWAVHELVVAESLHGEPVVHHPFLQVLPSLGATGVELVHAFKRDSLLCAKESLTEASQNSIDVVYSLVEGNLQRQLEGEMEKLDGDWSERRVTLKVGRPEKGIAQAVDETVMRVPNGVLLALGRSREASEFSYLGSVTQHLISTARVPTLILPGPKAPQGTRLKKK